MIGIPYTISIVIVAAYVLVIGPDSLPNSPLCFCAAFQHQQSSSTPRLASFRYSRTNIPSAMTNAENGDRSWNSLAPTKYADEKDGDDSSSFRSLQTYVESLLSKKESSATAFACQLVPSDKEDSLTGDANVGSGLSGNFTITDINTIIFRPTVAAEFTDSTTYAVAIVPSSDRVDVRRFSEELKELQQRDKNGSGGTFYDQWELAPSDIVHELCGFEPGTIPPLLVPPAKGGDVGELRRPVATILDSSLLWNQTNPAENRLILQGGGGSTNHRCLVDSDFLVSGVLDLDTQDLGQPSRTLTTKIASIVRFEGGMNHKPEVATTAPSSSNEINNRHTTSDSDLEKPFFQIAPPPGSTVTNNGGSGQPHRPVAVSAIGRVVSVRQIAKRLVFADFAPPDTNYERWLLHKQKDGPYPLWRSGEDGRDMYVQVIVGKTFCERYEDGTERLKSLKPGKLVHVRGAANVDPMQKNGWRNSSGNWAQKRSLDVIVSSFQILDEDDNDDSLRMLVEEAQREVARRGTSNSNWNSLLPWERKFDFQRRAVGGAFVANGTFVDESQKSTPTVSDNFQNSDSINELTLGRFNTHLRDDPLDIKIVDNDDAVTAMALDISELFSQIEKDDHSSNLLDYVAGIDCEWRPTGAYAEALQGGPDDNPVALLQICVPAIGKVYLVDTHLTLRANLADTEAMTEIESIFSNAICTMFGSETMIKVGYGVVLDFRRLAASFPHIPSFQTVRSVVELETLAQRLHPKSAKPWLSSLQKLTKLVLGYTITKEQQCSDWEARPLTSSQIEYATLDCALPPRLLDEMAEGSGNNKMREVLPGVTKSWRFQTIDGARKDAIRRLRAKRVVGNTFVVTQSWLNRSREPDPASILEEGGGPFTDTDGILRMPADLVSIGGSVAPWKSMAGKTVEGGKKKDCIDLLAGDAMPDDAILDYNPRSGFITFQDGLALFVNMPDPSRLSRRRMPYPNEWLEDGRILTWYIRKNDWDNGNSETAKLLLGSKNDDSKPSSVVLFVRMGTKGFVCCGSCNALVSDDNAKANKLVKLKLQLNDWETMKDTISFSQLLEALKPNSNPNRRREDPVPIENRLVQAVVDGNIIGAFGMALDACNVGPKERSIAKGRSCIATILSNSDDPLALRAKEIIGKMTV